jgi:hypothetical protein
MYLKPLKVRLGSQGASLFFLSLEPVAEEKSQNIPAAEHKHVGMTNCAGSRFARNYLKPRLDATLI